MNPSAMKPMIVLQLLLCIAVAVCASSGAKAHNRSLDYEGWHEAGSNPIRFKVSQGNVVELSNLSSPCGSSSSNYGPFAEAQGEVVKVNFDSNGLHVKDFVLEGDAGTREDVDLDPSLFDGVALADKGWIEQGLQRLLRSGMHIHLTLQGCGMSARVEELHSVKLIQNQPDARDNIHLSQNSTSIEVPLVKEAGVLKVPVVINGVISLNFVLDSGAADVSIPADVVSTLARSGSIASSDFMGERTYVMADGSSIPSRNFHIHSLKIGNKVIDDVVGSIANPKGELLLGQSFLERFKGWSIDNHRQVLVLQ